MFYLFMKICCTVKNLYNLRSLINQILIITMLLIFSIKIKLHLRNDTPIRKKKCCFEYIIILQNLNNCFWN